jgi:hypothetical protein
MALDCEFFLFCSLPFFASCPFFPWFSLGAFIFSLIRVAYWPTNALVHVRTYNLHSHWFRTAVTFTSALRQSTAVSSFPFLSKSG